MAPDQVKDRKAIFIANDGFPVDQTKSRVGVVLARAQKERAPAICRGPEAEVFSGQWAV